MPALLLVVSGLAAGCGGSTPPVATSTVTSVVMSTQINTVTETNVVLTTSVEMVTSVATAPDPDTPGPVGGAVCASNPSYFDEKSDGLDPTAVSAWDAAKTAASAEGVVLCLNDGKRSRAQQEETYASYVAQYGEDAANTYVLPPDKSAHVAGYAIDVQPASGYSWLEATNGRYGLCRTYDNEAWHFEYARSFTLGCPPRRPQPLR